MGGAAMTIHEEETAAVWLSAALRDHVTPSRYPLSTKPPQSTPKANLLALREVKSST